MYSYFCRYNNDRRFEKDIIALMVEQLTMLRAKLDFTQAELAEVVGISRYTLIAIEKKQRKMTWNTFLFLSTVGFF